MIKDTYIHQNNWLNYPLSLYKCPADNTGNPSTFRDILFSKFGIDHEFFYRLKKEDPWISGLTNDLSTIITLRKNPQHPDKPIIKQTLQCYTPSAIYKTKKKGREEIIGYNPILQVDIDHIDKMGIDIEEIKAAIFELPYVAFVGKSVTGTGIYVYILIAEPGKLRQYAEHIFQVLRYYELPVDASKGRNYSDLRFVSYDANMLVREDPEPLKITAFHRPQEPQKPKTQYTPTPQTDKTKQGLINWAVREIQSAIQGNRWATVQKVSYTMGGNGIGLDEIKHAIINSPEFSGCEEKYIVCADDCFNDGMKNPLSL
jgi:hypothetical protein